jgi:hypothetical protein
MFPAIAAIASIFSTVAGAGVSIYGQQQQAKAQTAAANYNNRLAEREAQNREAESHEQISRERIQKRRYMGELRNRLAGQGTLNTSGTPLAVLGEASTNMELRIQDAFRASNMQAAAMRSQGQMGLWEASQARTAANLNSVATGLKTVSRTAGDYAGYKHQGIF